MNIDYLYLVTGAAFTIGLALGYSHNPQCPIPPEPELVTDTFIQVQRDTVFIGETDDTVPEYVANYINRFRETALQEQDRFGIPASIKLAQAMLETGFGRSYVAKYGKNHFGIKNRVWDEPMVDHVVGYVHAIDDCDGYCKFQKFKTDWASWRAHSLILQNERYSSLKGVTDYREYAIGLQRCGYATSDDYAKKLISIITKYELHVYDVNA